MNRSTFTTRTRSALSAFLDSHVGDTFRDDIGPLLGQMSEIRDHGLVDETSRRWREAVNAAVASEALRDVATVRRSRGRRSR